MTSNYPMVEWIYEWHRDDPDGTAPLPPRPDLAVPAPKALPLPPALTRDQRERRKALQAAYAEMAMDQGYLRARFRADGRKLYDVEPETPVLVARLVRGWPWYTRQGWKYRQAVNTQKFPRANWTPEDIPRTWIEH